MVGPDLQGWNVTRAFAISAAKLIHYENMEWQLLGGLMRMRIFGVRLP